MSENTEYIEIKLDQITHGWIKFRVCVMPVSVTFLMNRTFDTLDDLVLFVKQVHKTGEGKYCFNDAGRFDAILKVSSLENSNLCRVQVGSSERSYVLDVKVTREAFYYGFQSLFRKIAHDCRLGPMWLHHPGLDESEFDPICDEADQVQEAGVKGGKWMEDIDDQLEFEAEYVSARIKLSPEQDKYTETVKRMLMAV